MIDGLVPWDDQAALEELFMNAAEGDDGSIAQLTAALRVPGREPVSAWAGEIREAWTSGVELLTEARGDGALSPAAVAWLHALAGVGYDSRAFRDLLARAARTAFSAYADPAGLLGALGIQREGTPTTTVAGRWDVFSAIAVGVTCYHPGHGCGRVVEIDALGNDLHIDFGRRQVVPLAAALNDLVVVLIASLIDQLRRGEARWEDALAGPEWHRQLAESLVPPDGAAGLIEKLLVPDVLSATQWRAATGVATGGAVRGRRRQPQADGAAERLIAEARTLVELREQLRRAPKAGLSAEDAANSESLLRSAGSRLDLAECYCETVAMLWGSASGNDWLREMLQDKTGGGPAVCWRDPELFVSLTDASAGKLVPKWLAASHVAVGPAAFCELCVELPLRLWTPVEKTLRAAGGDIGALASVVQGRARSGRATADMLVWLWRSKLPERELLLDVSVMFKTLGQPVKGAFIRAHRDLRKLLTRDDSFHQFLVEGRSESTLPAFVRTLEQAAILEQGERQSLLVRLVRIFPDLRPLIEKRAPATRRKAQDQDLITSRRSYEARREELRELIEVKIPANSRAIAHARSYGDLRENAEYKAAKEEQAFLGARCSEMELALDRVKPVDFEAGVEPPQAIPGSLVTLIDAVGAEQQFYLLGMWDSDPDRKLLSYDAPLGKLLLGKRPGGQVEMPNGGQASVTAVGSLPQDLVDWLNLTSDA